MKVLIVDDSGLERDILKSAIERYGHETREAEDGNDGIEKAAIYKPDLIISDVLMPNMDGFQFFKNIKQDEALKSIPFVFYSAVDAGDMNPELAESFGVSAFIIKPKDPGEFSLKIKNLLEEGIKGKKKRIEKKLLAEEEFLRNYSYAVVKKLEEKTKALEMEIARRKLTEARHATLFTLSNIFAEHVSLHAAAPRVLQSICEGFGWVMGELWRVDRKSNVLRLDSLWHIPTLEISEFEDISYLITLPPGACLPGRAWTSEQPAIWITDMLAERDFFRDLISHELGLRGAVAFPIKKLGKVTGVMAFFSANILQPDNALFNVMADIGKHIGMFINRKLAEEQLHESERKHRLLLENLPQKIFHKDKNSIYVLCNENYARHLKIKPEEIVGKSDDHFFPKKLAEKYRADDRRILESGKQETFEERYIKDGQELIVQTVKTPFKDEKGNIIGIAGVSRDVAGRKQVGKVKEKAKEIAFPYTENISGDARVSDFYYP